MKVVEKALESGLFTTNRVSDYQYGLKPVQSITDVIFVMMQLHTKTKNNVVFTY